MTRVSNDKIVINPKELKARLGGADDSASKEFTDSVADEILSAMNCSYILKKADIRFTENGCNLGFGNIASANLRRNLTGCGSAYVLAATIGHDVDRVLRNASLVSTAKHFVLDAVASSAVEALCDYIQDSLPEQTKARFAPGYGDFTLEMQGRLLEFVDAYKIGISVNDSFMMTPMKTITAIMGIKL